MHDEREEEDTMGEIQDEMRAHLPLTLLAKVVSCEKCPVVPLL